MPPLSASAPTARGILAYHGIGSGLVHFPVAVAVSGLFALATGAICLRTRGVYFIMITMAFAQMAYYFFLSLEVYGGDDGLPLYNRSSLPLAEPAGPADPLPVRLCLAAGGLYLKHRIVNSRFGLVIQGAKDNDTRMRTLGYNTYAYRLVAYVISGAMAGYAGALLGNFTSYISPAMMSWTRSGELMFMVILGRCRIAVRPGVRGHRLSRAGGVSLHHDDILAASLRASAHRGGAVCQGRVVGLARPVGSAAVTAPMLSIEGLSKSFGGVMGVRPHQLKRDAGRVSCPHRSQRRRQDDAHRSSPASSRPTAARCAYRGRDITRLPVHKRSLIGIARSFQITTVLLSMSALDNVALAVQARDGHSFRFWAPARADPSLREPAMAMLEQVGLGERAHETAATLSHGERRQLEIAMALALQADLLLLDEPTAGMGPEEAGQIVEILRQLKQTKTMLLIEHDMDAVFALADRISVLVYGRVIATGTPEEIRADERCAGPISARTERC
jgi:ABC-type branched-subunit amino acid transport system ATPase component